MTLPGIDVSEAQGPIDWSKVTGVDFAFLKAWEHRLDHQYHANWAGAQLHNIRSGAYCFARPAAYAPEVQAKAFCDTVGPLHPGQLPLVLDLEDSGGMAPPTLAAWAAAFLRYCDDHTGRLSIFYTYSGFLSGRLLNDPRLAHWTTWIAAYQAKPPPTPWPYSFWQHADNGTIPGINGHVDLNVYNGSMDTLMVLTAESGTTPAPPEEEDPVAPTDVTGHLTTEHGEWLQTRDGGIITIAGDFHGSYPQLVALGKADKPRQFIAELEARADGEPGYVLTSIDATHDEKTGITSGRYAFPVT